MDDVQIEVDGPSGARLVGPTECNDDPVDHIAGVTPAVAITIRLVVVRRVRTIVTHITHAIVIPVGLVVVFEGAIILSVGHTVAIKVFVYTGVTDAVSVRVSLVVVRLVWAIVTGVSDTIIIPVRLLGVPNFGCLLYTSPSPRDKRQSRMPSSA